MWRRCQANERTLDDGGLSTRTCSGVVVMCRRMGGGVKPRCEAEMRGGDAKANPALHRLGQGVEGDAMCIEVSRCRGVEWMSG